MSFVCGLFQGDETTVPAMCRGFYGPEWADRLYRGIARNVTSAFELVVLVDRDYAFEEPVRAVRMQRPDLGWMALLEAFRPDIGIERGIFLGLDSIVVGSLDELVALQGFAMPRDPYNTKNLCNAIILFDASHASDLWKIYSKHPNEWARTCRMCAWSAPQGYPSEFMWLRHVVPAPNVWVDDVLPEQVVSYKLHVLKESVNFPSLDPTQVEIDAWLKTRPTRIPSRARIVYFHGVPKCHQISASPGVEELLRHWV